MPERCVSFVPVGDAVTMVDSELPDDKSEPITIFSYATWRLQDGNRSEAYDVMYRRCVNYLKENGLAKVILKARALTMGSTKLGHLNSAELRGVVIGAAASVASIRPIAKALVSLT